jgi:hypothetical protein
MKLTSMKYSFAGIISAMIITALFFSSYQEARVAQGATIQGNDYQATSTGAASTYGAFTGSRLIKTGYGSFGNVVVTGANTGIVNFYDATTTDITLRTGNKSTSSILITTLPASMAANDYIFDVALSNGLYLELVSGIMPTTTVTYR